MDREDVYSLYFSDAQGNRTPILEGEKSARKVVNVASKLKKKRPFKTLVVERNGRPMRMDVLEKAVYQQWLEDHQADD